MAADPLAPLVALTGVREALDRARTDVDSALRHQALRRSGGLVAAEVGLRDAVASAALEGAGYDLESVRAGLVTDATVQGALRVSRELDRLLGVWRTAPRQALATLHLLAARDVVAPAELGRPRADAAVSARLDTLAGLVAGGSRVPALLLSAVVHGELLALRPFAGPNGVVARAAARLVLMSGGLDPRGLVPMSVGHLARQPEYLGASGAFATGTPDGIRSWLNHSCGVAGAAAAELTAIADEIRAG